MPAGPGATIHSSDLIQKRTLTDKAPGGVAPDASTSQPPLLFPTNTSNSIKENTSDTTEGRRKLNNIDLNNEYDGSQDCLEDLPDTFAPDNTPSAGSLQLHKDSQQLSPPQNSRNSGSTSSQSPSTSSGETQVRACGKCCVFSRQKSNFIAVSCYIFMEVCAFRIMMGFSTASIIIFLFPPPIMVHLHISKIHHYMISHSQYWFVLDLVFC